MAVRRAPSSSKRPATARDRPITDDQVLIDTSALTDVSINGTRRTAQVGSGVMWPAVQEAAQVHGLLGLSGTSPTVGVAGYTFGGGVGWFVRKYGLASGTLRAVDYVDGAGELRRASDDATDPVDREALLAFRGGAPVGIATSIEIGLFRVPELWTGYLLWPQSAFAAVIAGWASALELVSESVTSSLSLLQLPAEGPFPAELLGTPGRPSFLCVAGRRSAPRGHARRGARRGNTRR